MINPVHPTNWPYQNAGRPEFFFAVDNGKVPPDFFAEMAQTILCSSPEEIKVVPPSLADILVKAGVFPSKSQARKAGADGEPPDGLSLYMVGKLKTMIWIWTPITLPQEGNENG